MNNTITLQSITRARHQLSITYTFNDYNFEVALWYDTVDLLELEKRFGQDQLQRIYFHIAAFEFNKLVSLKPDKVDFGTYQDYCTPAFWALWDRIQYKVWSQWRYEHDWPDYKGPELAHAFTDNHQLSSINNQLDSKVRVLSFCGGGKDSLLSARLLESLNIPYASFVYSNSIYGPSKRQHQIVDKLLSGLKPEKIHRQYVYDSFVDCPIMELDNDVNVKSMLAAETPSSIFASLPIVLNEGYQHIALGHERSANIGNLIWDKTGEDVNHQWGKSLEAEHLINTYIQDTLINNFSYFSMLQPLQDVLIFNLLREHLDVLPHAHSCNIEKPWCKKCPKCAYVWLNYMAYLPTTLINSIFDHTNLFDVPENQLWFHQMLGLDEHTPFECIGQVEESRLALHLCKAKGLEGKAMELYEFIKNENFEAIAQQFTQVDVENASYPVEWREKLLEILKNGASDSQAYINSLTS